MSVKFLKISKLLFLHMLPLSSFHPVEARAAPLQWLFRPLGCDGELQHGYALRGTVEMCGCAAPPRGLEALGRPTQCRASGPWAHDNPWAVVVTLLQARHHGLAGDGAELVGEGAVEDQDVHCEDPLTDGCGMLQDETLMDEEDAAWEGGGGLRRTNTTVVHAQTF